MTCQSSILDRLPGSCCSTLNRTSDGMSLRRLPGRLLAEFGRVQHRVFAVRGPHLRKIAIEAGLECLASANRPTIWVSGLTWLPLSSFADFSYMRHVFSPDNFHCCGGCFNVVGLPYSFQGQSTMDEISGCSPYGASTITKPDGSRMPSENELAGARFQGRHVAQIASKLKA